MKIYSLILVFFFNFLSCQYIDIESLKSTYLFKKYTLNTKGLYNFESQIELYNFFIDPNKILLISILPDIRNNENWKKSKQKPDKINYLEFEDIFKNDYLDDNKKKLVYNTIYKTENGFHYSSYVSLIELFTLENSNKIGVININQNKYSIKDSYSLYKKRIKFEKSYYPFLLDPRNIDLMGVNITKNEDRQYLSRKLLIKNKKAYQFWTFKDWGIIDGYNYQRGIDRFIYIPKLGVVGGSYDFYFAFKPRTINKTSIAIPVSEEKIWKNILNEKVIIAKELRY